MFTEEKKTFKSIASVWSSWSFKGLFDQPVAQLLPTQAQSVMEDNQQKVANKAKLWVDSGADRED